MVIPIPHPFTVFPVRLAAGGRRREDVPAGLAAASLNSTSPPDATRPPRLPTSRDRHAPISIGVQARGIPRGWRGCVLALLMILSIPLAGAEEPGPLQRGEALLKEGKLPEAQAALQEAVAADPQSSLALQRLGGAQLMSQDYAGSIQSFQRAIGLDPRNAEAFVGMGMAYLHTGRLGLARAALEEAKRIDPAKQIRIDEVIAWIDRRVSD